MQRTHIVEKKVTMEMRKKDKTLIRNKARRRFKRRRKR